MTTITPTPAHTINLTATLTSPLHHGAGTSGNTALLRTHEIVMPDGTHAKVPFLSANSIRHGLRDALAWHLTATLGIEDGTLTKGIVDLLWSGGAVTKTGAETDLALARRVDDLLPQLGLLGFAAQSDITGGTLRVSDLEVVARENAWRLPEALRSLPQASQGVAAFRAEEFGTRNDVATSPVARFVDVASELVGTTKTTQMIYDAQVLIAGTVLYGTLGLTPAASAPHRIVLEAALALWAPGGVAHLGAKTSVGYGRALIDGIPASAEESLATLTDSLAGRATDIPALLAEVAG